MTVKGKVRSTGLTCLRFDADDHKTYDLTGAAVPDQLRAIAHQPAPSLTDVTARDPDAGATVEVVGRLAPDAVSTCGLPVLVAEKVHILSLSTPK